MGLLFYKDPLPGVFNNTVDVLANSTSFLMMFSLGLTIVWRDLTTFWQANLLNDGFKLCKDRVLGDIEPFKIPVHVARVGAVVIVICLRLAVRLDELLFWIIKYHAPACRIAAANPTTKC